jgi:two-component system cell cycle response regulator
MTSRIGFEVEVAPDGEAGLAMLEAGAFDVAIVDQAMPRLTGIQLVAALREREATKGIYALMLTVHDDMPTKLAALDAGFDDFVAKSSPEVEIVAKVVAARRIAARQRTMDVAIRELYGLATRDELTGTFNRRFFLAEAERLLGGGAPLSLILFDLDGFKQVNDTHGHMAGDRVLCDIAALFQRNTRSEDIVARFGGDEFVLAIPQLEFGAIQRLALRLAQGVQQLRWMSEGAVFTIGVSTGIASSRVLAKPSLGELLHAADRDMYRSKWLRKHTVPSDETQAPANAEKPSRRSEPPLPESRV